MRVVGRNISDLLHAGVGCLLAVELIPSDDDDLWNLYNLIRHGDNVTAVTTRKVKIVTGDGETTKGGGSARETLRLTVKVKNLDFDPAANELRLGGTVQTDTAAVSAGQSHSLTIRNDTQVRIDKGEDGWDSVDLAHLREVLTGEKQDAIPAIIMQQGRAMLVMIREARTVVLANIESSAVRSKNTADSKGPDKATQQHHERVLAAIRENIDMASPKEMLFVGPGFWAQAFRDYLLQVAIATDDKKLRALVNKAVSVHSSVGLSHGLSAILDDPKVKGMMKNMRFGSDGGAIERFTQVIKKDETRAWYGPGPVAKAVEAGGVGPGQGELLILDKLFRSTDLDIRKKYVALVDNVKAAGGKVTVIGSENPSGDQLKQLGGVAAILTYGMDDLDEDGEPDYGADDEDFIV